MNIQHLRYAVEVARTGSINKAAHCLLVAQPNLSRSIKDLEASLGVKLFDRSPLGMTMTPAGEEFVGYAARILSQIEEVENLYKDGLPVRNRITISLSRTSYAAEALVNFTRRMGSNPVEIFYLEGNSRMAVQNVTAGDSDLGIVRYALSYEMYYKAYLEEKGLDSRLIGDFQYICLMSEHHRLADREVLKEEDLQNFIEIAAADPYVPSISVEQVRKTQELSGVTRHIYVADRASQFELLSSNPETFAFVSPLPKDILDRYHLVQREAPFLNTTYRDILIYSKYHDIKPFENDFIEELIKARKETMKR